MNNNQLKYIQKINVNKFSIVEYFRYFGYKEREVANGSFIDLVKAILSLPKADKDLTTFAEFHYSNDYAILDSDLVVLYWLEKTQKSIQHINNEIAIKKKKLDALLVLDQVNTLLDIKEKEVGMSNNKRKIAAVKEEEDEELWRVKKEFNDARAIEEEAELTAIGSRPVPSPRQNNTPQAEDIPQTIDNVDVIEYPPQVIDDINMGLFLANFRPTLGNKLWMIGKRNVLKSWMLFKAQCAEKCSNEGIQVKEDPQTILAMSHILFVESKKNSTFINEYFDSDTLSTIRKDIQNRIGIKDSYSFGENVQTEANETIQRLLRKKVGKRRLAAGEIIKLAVTLPEDEYLILSELVSMINYLPRRSAINKNDRPELSTTDYANSVLRPLFENVNAKRKLRWSSKNPPQEASLDERTAVVHSLLGRSLAIGQVTPTTGDDEEDSFNASAGQIRLAIRAKEIIDGDLQSCLRNVMLFQIVGMKITFYVMSLLHEGMYAMIDVAEIDIPQSVEDLLPFVSNIQASLSVSNIFKDCCNREDRDVSRRDYARPTLSTPKFDSLIK